MSEIKSVCKSTARPGADVDIGGFGGNFDLKAAGYKDPILVSGTDGVGTKLKVIVDILPLSSFSYLRLMFRFR